MQEYNLFNQRNIMKIDFKKINPKKSRKIYLISLILCVVIGFIFYKIIYATPYLKQDQQVRKSPRICVHTLGINGSHEGLELVSYPCDNNVNWERLQDPAIETFKSDISRNGIFKEEGTLDNWVTPECPKLYFEKSRIDSFGLIIMKQGSFCKAFAHDYLEPTLQHVIVNEEGKFEIIYQVDSKGKISTHEEADVVTDCPFINSVSQSRKIQSRTVKKVSCVMTSGKSGYSNPNIIALYELESTSENNNNPWYIRVYEQDGKNLYDVLEVPGPSFEIDKVVIVLQKDGDLCVLDDSRSCHFIGLISHSPPREGYTNEKGYRITWKL